jgi:O-antigen/teichoic acid export membrane protein
MNSETDLRGLRRVQIRKALQRLWQSAVAWTFLATFLRLGASVLVLPVILRKLPPEHLGLWYVFGTIGSFAVLLDFGFEPTVTRMAAYAWGGASRFIAFGVHEDKAAGQPNRPLLRDLVATLKAYYFWVGLAVLALLAFGGGAWVWVVTAKDPAATSLRLAWLVYATGSCLNFVNGRWPQMLTGIGALREGQFISIVSQSFYYAVAVGGLLAGFGLWALVVALAGSGWLLQFSGKRMFRRMAALPDGLPSAHLHREIISAIWPNAWRMGLASLGSFLINRSNTLICSGFLGLETTGSYGMSVQLISILVGLSMVWVDVKMPLINQLRIQGRSDDIVHIFAVRLRLVILSFLIGALAILFLAPAALRIIGSKTTLLPFGPLAVLTIILFLEMHHWLYARLVLSENYNPFPKPAIVSGTAIVIVSLILTPKFGIWGLIISQGAIQACYNNWWCVVRALRGLNVKPSHYFLRHFLALRARHKS